MGFWDRFLFGHMHVTDLGPMIISRVFFKILISWKIANSTIYQLSIILDKDNSLVAAVTFSSILLNCLLSYKVDCFKQLVHIVLCHDEV